MQYIINILTKMKRYDGPKNGNGTDIRILEVDPSSLPGKLMSPAVRPKG